MSSTSVFLHADHSLKLHSQHNKHKGTQNNCYKFGGEIYIKRMMIISLIEMHCDDFSLISVKFYVMNGVSDVIQLIFMAFFALNK